MKDRNICKFIEESAVERLTTKSFIYESNPQTMSIVQRLSGNRIFLVTESGGEWHFDKLTIKLKKGDVIFGFSGERVFVQPEDGCEYSYIDIDGTRCTELFKRFGISHLSRQFSGHEGLIAFWSDAISRAAGINLDLISESVVLYSFSQLAAPETVKNGAAEMILEIIDEEFSDPKLSLLHISERLGYNTKYLSHIFKEKTGRGFSEYLRTVRIRHAVFLMDKGLESVKNIAYFCGFDDPLYFSTVFKKVVGVSPNSYIRQNIDNYHSEGDK